MIGELVEIAQKAGDRIMEYYESEGIEVSYKDDDSPLTLADKASHDLICESLKQLYPEIPVISEEDESHVNRDKLDVFFLVDPLDGTKEFIKKNGEFTVNIGLIKNGEPVMGVIYAPATGVTYYADKGSGAYKIENGDEVEISKNTNAANAALISRSHAGPEEMKQVEEMGIAEILNVGSSLKFCWLAEAKARVYLRKTPICLWDIAAACAIAIESGIKVETYGRDKIDFLGSMTVPGIYAFREESK